MGKEIIQGTQVNLSCNVWDLSVSPKKPKAAGTIYAAIRLDKPGDADDGKYWDMNVAGHDWIDKASVVTWPEMTYMIGAAWTHLLEAAATAGKAGGRVVLDDATDDIANPAASTTEAIDRESAGIVSSFLTSSGLREIIIHCETAAPVSVSDMTVCIYDVTETNLVGRLVTDAGGDTAAFHLDDGTYVVRTAKAGYTTLDTAITVTADATEDITVTALPVPASASPDKCIVSGYLLDANGVGVTGETITFYPDAPEGVDGTGYFMSATGVAVVTGPLAVVHPAWPAGYLEIELVRETKVRLSSRVAKLDGVVITIPDSASASFGTLIEDAIL